MIAIGFMSLVEGAAKRLGRYGWVQGKLWYG